MCQNFNAGEKNMTCNATVSPSRLITFSVLAATLVAPLDGFAVELEGYTEPFRTIEVAADETGTVERVNVKQGDLIRAGDLIAVLNSDLHIRLLKIAEQNMVARGRLEAAKADREMRQLRLGKLTSLREKGHARQEEVDRARAELAIAEANLLAVEEDQITRRLEYEKMEAQIRRRSIYAPVDGVVAVVLKEPGEFVAPTDPELITLVQLDKLLVNFTVMGDQAESITIGQELDVRFSGQVSKAKTTVHYIAPVTDAESGTVLVKLKLDNSKSQFRSGQRCKIFLPK